MLEEGSRLAKILTSEMVQRNVVLERLDQLIDPAVTSECAIVDDIAAE